MNTLLDRFKKVYEEGTNYKVSMSDIDENNNLTVWIVDAEGEEQFYLNIREYENGDIYWF